MVETWNTIAIVIVVIVLAILFSLALCFYYNFVFWKNRGNEIHDDFYFLNPRHNGCNVTLVDYPTRAPSYRQQQQATPPPSYNSLFPKGYAFRVDNNKLIT